jgi:hypothetical protein
MSIILKETSLLNFIDGKIASSNENEENLFSSPTIFFPNEEIPFLSENELETFFSNYQNNPEEKIFFDLIEDTSDIRFKKYLNPTFFNLSKENIELLKNIETHETSFFKNEEDIDQPFLNLVNLTKYFFYLEEFYSKKRNILTTFGKNGILDSSFSKSAFFSSSLKYDFLKAGKKNNLEVSNNELPFFYSFNDTKYFYSAIKVENCSSNNLSLYIFLRDIFRIDFERIETSREYNEDNSIKYYNYIFFIPKYLMDNSETFLSGSEKIFIEGTLTASTEFFVSDADSNYEESNVLFNENENFISSFNIINQ